MYEPAIADDSQLYEMARSGNSEAFTQLMNRHKDPLVNYLTRMTGNRDRSEDLAQEAFLRLYERGHAYVEQGKLKAYLYRIATNVFRSQLRREKRWSTLQTLFFSPNGNRTESSPQSNLLDRELGDRLASAILALPVRYRGPLILSRVEGWTHRQIAAALGCREGTVKSRIHRARRLLQEHLAPYLNGDAK